MVAFFDKVTTILEFAIVLRYYGRPAGIVTLPPMSALAAMSMSLATMSTMPPVVFAPLCG
jgi:type III secretory pathway component EscR